ncbi:cell division protein FtsB [Streptomyces sp. V3I8]|uniref:hypothetical protein n=1 Tax=Streptomyces sp. V3I8 TaxID=3042279 RepID=UPI002784FCC9|nr:hypothetical protein [Streptomyces sp. V3I8]MDQ1040541.1 cell division protein FtsB [Streptomyces sp. V3I8]
MPQHEAPEAVAALHRTKSQLATVPTLGIDAIGVLQRASVTDGSVTAVNIAAEGGVSRASYYRSPVAPAIKEILSAPDIKRPKVDELKAEVARLRKKERALRQEHAAEVRELKDTTATYANQIQILSLRNAELERDAGKLRSQLSSSDGVVCALRPT